MPKSPVSFVVLTLDEERNIRYCLRSLMHWAAQVFVLDSHSSDDTVAIARAAGAEVVQRRFDNYSSHRNWALDKLPFTTEWVFFLDADERVSEALRHEVAAIVEDAACPYAGYYVRRRIRLFGGWLRHGGYVVLRLFKRRQGRWEPRLVHEHVAVDGRMGYLRNDLINEDHKGLERYFDRHNTYSSLEAIEVDRYLTGLGSGGLEASVFGSGPQRRRWMKQVAYRVLPCRPMFKFLWLYLLRGCLLDGRAGFRHSMLQAFYEYQVSLKLGELRSKPLAFQGRRTPDGVAVDTAGLRSER